MPVTISGSVGRNVKTRKLGSNLPGDVLKVQRLRRSKPAAGPGHNCGITDANRIGG
jgi:hypothetical protein